DRLIGVWNATAHSNVVTTLGLFEHHARVLVGDHDLACARVDGDVLPLVALEVCANRLHSDHPQCTGASGLLMPTESPASRRHQTGYTPSPPTAYHLNHAPRPGPTRRTLVSAEMETAGIEPASAVAYEWLLRA